MHLAPKFVSIEVDEGDRSIDGLTADSHIVDILNSYGLIVVMHDHDTGHDFAKFAAPLLYTLWLSSSSPTFDNMPHLSFHGANMSLDCIKLICHCMQMVSFRTLSAAESENSNKVFFIDDQLTVKSISEHAIHFQLFAAMQYALGGVGARYKVIPEAKNRREMGSKRLGILLRNSHNYEVELGSEMTPSQIKNRFSRLITYAKALKCKESYLINFTTRPFSHQLEHPSSENPFIRTVHIYLELSARRFTIHNGKEVVESLDNMRLDEEPDNHPKSNHLRGVTGPTDFVLLSGSSSSSDRHAEKLDDEIAVELRFKGDLTNVVAITFAVPSTKLVELRKILVEEKIDLPPFKFCLRGSPLNEEQEKKFQVRQFSQGDPLTILLVIVYIEQYQYHHVFH